MKLVSPCLLLILSSLPGVPAHAVDMAQPAQINVIVQDMAGHPLPQAHVTTGPDTISLDAAGRGQSQIFSPEPASDIFWTEPVSVTLSGYLPYVADLRCFPGAQIAYPITLYPPKTTRLSLHGPNGKALAGVRVEVGYETAASAYLQTVRGYTNPRGDYVFTHPPLKSGFTISVASDSRNFRSPEYPDAAVVTVTLNPDEMPSGVPAHPMRLTLIAPDGTPAAGWQVAQHVKPDGTWSSASIMSLNSMNNGYAASEFTKTDKNGRVLILHAEEHLAVFSPQGVPFLYPLHPQTWPDGLHRVTLRLPPVRRTQTGQLTYPNGKPAADFPLHVSSAHTGTETWQVQSGEPTGAFFTDAEGRYGLPQYFGTSYEYEARQPPLYAYNLATTEGSVLHDTGASFARKPPEYKQVTLMFQDESGAPLPEISVDNYDSYKNQKKVAIYSNEGVMDNRGVHLFIGAEIDRIVVTTKAHNWNPVTQTLDVPGRADHAFTIIMPQALHLKPLTGLVLAPDGHHVSGVAISLWSIGPENNSYQHQALGFSTETDLQGCFTFAAAPEICQVDFYQPEGDLPGLADPPIVTPQARYVTIQLKPYPTGTARALLPESVKTRPEEIYLKSTPAGDRLTDYLTPQFDAEAHTLHWNHIPPGRYTLITGDPPKLPEADRLALPVTITEGREAEIDLRDKAATFPPPITPTTIRIGVSDGSGKPVSGATVTIWTDQRAWERHLPADLTDDDGMAWLPLGVGQRGVVVAHAAGRLIGWGDITGAVGEGLFFGLEPAKTLAVHLTALPLVGGKPPYDSREVWLRPTGRTPEEAQAVLYVLGLLNADTGFLGDGPVPSALLTKDAEGTWLAQDLPPWAYHLETGSDVTLADTDPSAVGIPLQAPSKP